MSDDQMPTVFPRLPLNYSGPVSSQFLHLFQTSLVNFRWRRRHSPSPDLSALSLGRSRKRPDSRKRNVNNNMKSKDERCNKFWTRRTRIGRWQNKFQRSRQTNAIFFLFFNFTRTNSNIYCIWVLQNCPLLKSSVIQILSTFYVV